jgi:glycosyltransferase involved in cell wall biosynthesis
VSRADAPLHLTVAICTWNRCRLLQQALEQLAGVRVPRGVTWEVLVVNNNSTDQTDAVVDSFAGRLPVRRLFEPTQGKSHALNNAVASASGEYILWTDDDALVVEEWLAAYVEAFRRWPAAAIFGGPVEPWFEGAPPGWLRRAWRSVGTAYALRDLGPEPLPFSPRALPYGVNMAIRMREQAQYRYDTALGPRGGRHTVGEETALLRSMLAAGASGWWVPEARVRHFIPAARQTTTYLRDYFTRLGEIAAREITPDGSPRWLGRPRWMWRQAIEREVTYRIHRLTRGPEVWLRSLEAASECRGTLRAYGRREG